MTTTVGGGGLRELPPPSDPWRPSVLEVAEIIRARTKDDQLQELGTFTADTRPTEEQVQATITTAYNLFTGPLVPQARIWELVGDRFDGMIRALIAYRAALRVEKSYWPDQVLTDRSAYTQLLAEYQADLARFREAYDEEIGAGPEDGVRFLIPTPSLRGYWGGYWWDDHWPEPENPANWRQPLQPPRQPPLPADLPVGDEPASGWPV